MFSQAFLTEGRAPWGKMQSIFALVRYFGGTEQLALGVPVDHERRGRGACWR